MSDEQSVSRGTGSCASYQSAPVILVDEFFSLVYLIDLISDS
jgi:hypothetical protein